MGRASRSTDTSSRPEVARVTQKVALLYRSHCEGVIEENLSPDAEELIGWISPLA
jgi:hypothetical protein